jgi:multisubunit Na+/H+ antiporter MnhF subunit
VSAFVLASAAMLLALVPLAITARRGTTMEAVVAYEAASSIAVMVFVMLPEAFGRSAEFEFSLLFAVLLLGSGLVYVHALERWL